MKRILGLGDTRDYVLYCIHAAGDATRIAGKKAKTGEGYIPLFTDPLNAEEWIAGTGWDRDDFEIAGPLDEQGLEVFAQDLIENTEFEYYTVNPPPRTDLPFTVAPLFLLPQMARIINATR